jgi:hypothetical protein
MVLNWMVASITRGRAIAQAASRWLPTAAARVRARIWSCGICGGQSCAGAGFLRVLRFPLPLFIPPIAPTSPSSIIWGLYNRPEVAAVPSGLSPTPLKKALPEFNLLLNIKIKMSNKMFWRFYAKKSSSLMDTQGRTSRMSCSIMRVAGNIARSGTERNSH